MEGALQWLFLLSRAESLPYNYERTGPSSIPAHKRQAGLVVLPDYQLRETGPGRE